MDSSSSIFIFSLDNHTNVWKNRKQQMGVNEMVENIDICECVRHLATHAHAMQQRWHVDVIDKLSHFHIKGFRENIQWCTEKGRKRERRRETLDATVCWLQSFILSSFVCVWKIILSFDVIYWCICPCKKKKNNKKMYRWLVVDSCRSCCCCCCSCHLMAKKIHYILWTLFQVHECTMDRVDIK